MGLTVTYINVFSFFFPSFSVSYHQLLVAQQRTMDLIYSPTRDKRLFQGPENTIKIKIEITLLKLM